MRKIEVLHVIDKVLAKWEHDGKLVMNYVGLPDDIEAALLAEWPELGWECREIEDGQVIASFPIHDFDGDYHICLNCGTKREDAK